VPVAVAPAAAIAPPVADAPAVATPAPAPTYVADKFQSPRLASRTCIGENLRLPSQLDDNAPELITARVEVGVTGMPKQVQVIGEGVDLAISDAIRRAVLACEWVPGADAQGKPAQFWAVLPIRLAR
jgi:protein TonB